MSEQKYCSFVTDAGTAQMVNAVLLGQKVELTDFAVGDGGGSYYMPTPQMTGLKHEVWRGKVTRLQQEAEHPEQFYISAVIPSQVGGFTIREMAVLDKDGLMIAVGNVADIQKVAIEEGMSSEIELSLHIAVNNAGALALKVDPTLIIATKADIEEHNQSLEAHMDIRKQLAELSGISENAEWFHTYTHTKSGSIHHLEGSGAIVKFKAAADFLKGDVFQVNGAETFALMLDRKELPDDAFKTGAWVMAILDGDTLTFQQKSGAATAAEVPIDPIEGMSAVNVQEALAENFQSVVDGKNLLETAINDKKVTVSKVGNVATFAELKTGVDAIRLAPPNGMEWKQSNIEGKSVTKPYFEKGTWITLDRNGIFTSTTGKSWSTAPIPTDFDYPQSICYGNGIWVLGGLRGIRYSLDRKEWLNPNIVTNATTYDVNYNDGTWVAVGTGIYYSYDGKLWKSANIPISTTSSYFMSRVLYGNGVWVAGCHNGIIYSEDGANWKLSNINRLGIDNLSDLWYADGVWIAGDRIGPYLYYSYDGKIWNTSDITLDYAYRVCAHGENGIWVLAHGEGGKIRYSYNGKDWINSPSNVSILDVSEITYANGIWWMFNGYGSSGKSAYSYDGISWVLNETNNERILSAKNANGIWVGRAMDGDYYTKLIYSESLTPF